MATARSNLPKEMTPFGLKKAPPFGGKPAKKGKGKPFPFAAGGSVPAEDSPSHAAAMGSNPPSKEALDDGKPSGGGTARGGGAATRGKKFTGTF